MSKYSVTERQLMTILKTAGLYAEGEIHTSAEAVMFKHVFHNREYFSYQSIYISIEKQPDDCEQGKRVVLCFSACLKIDYVDRFDLAYSLNKVIAETNKTKEKSYWTWSMDDNSVTLNYSSLFLYKDSELEEFENEVAMLLTLAEKLALDAIKEQIWA